MGDRELSRARDVGKETQTLQVERTDERQDKDRGTVGGGSQNNRELSIVAPAPAAGKSTRRTEMSALGKSWAGSLTRAAGPLLCSSFATPINIHQHSSSGPRV
ncbi:hypothetical protein Q5P01_015218 [Channa striata]|uniref:Uncharacterized protein n=1 Tax=Channa striata TaxID=64152 RepID=A0AA88MGW8_CHASR|nr:hypothetical protein Q5P01_015218 [Channa striata]